MQKQKLPNSTVVLILGILSILTCCCYGVGIILGIVALTVAKKDLKLYAENPELYEGYSNINTGRILAIIGIVITSIYFVFQMYLLIFVGAEGIKDMQQNLLDKLKYQQEQNQ